jgi:hypothetical protein
MNKHPLINKFPGLDRPKTPKRKKSSDKSLTKSVYPKANYWVMLKNSLFCIHLVIYKLDSTMICIILI